MFFLAAALAHAEPYALADAGITMQLGANWHMSRWSDWDFDGKSADGSVFLQVWTTSFQASVTDENAKAWGAVYRQKLEDAEHATEIKLDEEHLENANGHPRARVTMSFQLGKGGGKGVEHVAAFATDGRIVHIATLAAGPNGARAAAMLEDVLQNTTVDKSPAEVPTTTATLTTAAWETPLPPGWRVPLASEADDIATLATKTPEKDPTKCAAAVRPYPGGEADLMLVCDSAWKLDILDEASFDDVSKLLVKNVFGKKASAVPPAEKVALPDRLGILVKPGDALHFGVIPWDAGALVVWSAGRGPADDELDNSLKATLAGFHALKGDGLPKPDFGAVLVHTLVYKPFSLPVLGSGLVCLGIFGALVRVIFRKKDPPAPTY